MKFKTKITKFLKYKMNIINTKIYKLNYNKKKKSLKMNFKLLAMKLNRKKIIIKL